MSLHQALPSALLDDLALESNVITVQVCVLTYKRPDLLRFTLESLICQNTHSTCSGFRSKLQIHILVIDNDTLKSGYLVTEELSTRSSFPIRYVSEPARGIASARNRALQESQSADFIAFIDDDETACINWLVYLVDAALQFKADIVTGPVNPQHHNSPVWIERGRFFSPKFYLTGSTIPHVATNNVLLRSFIVRNFRFDNDFDATGGEDTEFFMRLSRAGYNAIWTNEAVVTEYIPQERANLHWLLNRARSDANRFTRCYLSFNRNPSAIVRRFLVAALGFVTGAAHLPGVVFGRHHAARGLQLIYRSIGTVSALRGQAEVYYKASHD